MEGERKLLSIVFTDIKGYTAIMEKDEAVALTMVEQFENHTKIIATKHHGKVVHFMGDGALVIFDNSLDAVGFGVEIQTLFLTEIPIPHRVGINTGEAVMKDGNVYGDSVNVASRVESLGVPGCLLIADNTNRLIKNKGNFSTKSMGKFHFKNQSGLMEVFAVTNPPLVIPKRKDLSGKTEPKNLKIPAIIAIVAFLVLGAFTYYYAMKPTIIQEVNAMTWEGLWNVQVEAANGEYKQGSLDLSRVGESMQGQATIWYDSAKQVGIDFNFSDIIENEDGKSISGNWNSNMTGNQVTQGTFIINLDENRMDFKGEFTTDQSPQAFQWIGNRL